MKKCNYIPPVKILSLKNNHLRIELKKSNYNLMIFWIMQKIFLILQLKSIPFSIIDSNLRKGSYWDESQHWSKKSVLAIQQLQFILYLAVYHNAWTQPAVIISARTIINIIFNNTHCVLNFKKILFVLQILWGRFHKCCMLFSFQPLCVCVLEKIFYSFSRYLCMLIFNAIIPFGIYTNIRSSLLFGC